MLKVIVAGLVIGLVWRLWIDRTRWPVMPPEAEDLSQEEVEILRYIDGVCPHGNVREFTPARRRTDVPTWRAEPSRAIRETRH